MPTLERFKKCGAIFAETLGDSYPELERKGFTVNGDPQVVDTPYGKGMSFDGTGNYLVYSPSSNILQTDSAFTVSTWVKFDDFSDFRTIWSKQTSTSSTGLGVGLYVSTSGVATFYFFDGSGNIDNTNSASALSTDTWYLITATYDGSSACRLYINTTVSNNTVSGFSPAPAQNFTIGRLSYTNAFPHKGDATQVLVFPRALSAQEVSDLYNQTTFNYMDNLVSRWDMSEINPQDLVGSNNGTGTSIVASDIVVGQHGDAKAIEMDGTSDFVTVTNSDSLNFGTNGFSISGWFKSSTKASSQRIVYKDDGSIGYRVYLVATTGALAIFPRDGSNSADIRTTEDLADGKWHFYTYSHDKTNGVANILVDGVLLKSGSISSIGSVTNSADFLIATDSGGNRLNGFLGASLVHNYSLTTLQHRDLYEQTRLSSKSTSRINNPAYLKGYWPLNSHTDDVSGNGNDGVGTSTVYVDGPFGRTVGDFNNDGYIEVDSGIVGEVEELTVSLWTNKFTSSYVFSKDDITLGRDFAILQLSTNEYRVFVNGNGSFGGGQTKDYSVLAPSRATGVNHFAFTFKSGVLSLFVNGVEGTPTKITDNSFTTISSSVEKIWIGSTANNGASSNKATSDLSNVRIYNVALTGEEIQQIYRLEQFVPHTFPASQPYSALPDITDSSLVASHLNKATFGTGKDYSLNNNDMTNTAVVLGNDQGVFDNSSSSVLAGSATGITGSNPVTVCATIMITGSSSDAGIIGTGITNGFQLALHNGSTIYWYIQDGGNGLSVSGYSANTWHRVVATWDGTTNANGMKLYVDGELVGTKTSKNASISSNNVLQIGRATSSFTGTIKDTEVYSEAKDAAWVSQDYAKRVPDSNLLLHLKNGDKDLSRYNRTLTNTATIIGDGMVFDGADSKIDTGSDWIGTDDFSVIGWVNLSSFGESTLGRMLGNNKYVFALFGSRLLLNSDGATNARGDTILSLDQWIHVSATRTSTGVSNLYVNGLLDGDANQDSGTPEVGSSNVFVGNNSAGSRTFDGKIDDLRAYNRILTASEIKSHYLQTRAQY